MAFSGRARKWMQVWVVLAGVMFFARCADQVRPYLGVIFGARHGVADAPASPIPRPR